MQRTVSSIRVIIVSVGSSSQDTFSVTEVEHYMENSEKLVCTVDDLEPVLLSKFSVQKCSKSLKILEDQIENIL